MKRPIIGLAIMAAGLQFAWGALPYDREWDASAWNEAKAGEPADSKPAEQAVYWDNILTAKLATPFTRYNDNCALKFYWKRASLKDYTGLGGKIDQVLAKGGVSPAMAWYLRQAQAYSAIKTGDSDAAIRHTVWLFNNVPDDKAKLDEFYRLLREIMHMADVTGLTIPNRTKLCVQALTTVSVQVVSNNFIAVYERVPLKDLSTDEYIAFLKGVLKIVPATEANAQFLGRVKSELDKMQ
jgi:hypothetical protein